MLSIEEIKLLIEKLEKLKDGKDLDTILEQNLKKLKDLADVVDINNSEMIDRLDKTVDWFRRDLEEKTQKPIVDGGLYRMIQTKIFQFSKTNLYNSLEIGPGTGMFSKEFRAWRLNFFLDILPEIERKIRRRFNPAHQKYLKFYLTRNTECSNIPQGSCNLVFSWDTFVFFTQQHIQQYLHDIKRVLIPGGYVFIQYADCHYDIDLNQAKRGYWNYNTKTAMTKIIKDEGYEIVEMNMFRPGANYAIFRKPGKQNPVVYKFSEITLD
jgi:ubiquinone/menaquinone biosynthesis C-methylase UbiE